MKRPNILIILTDQQRYDTICQLGYPHMITPHLDQLVNEGCAYVNAYSSNPVCMPARYDLLTGLPGRAHGYYGNRESQAIQDYSLPTLPRIFAKAGYRTAAIGKMHFSPTREHHGYGEMHLMEEMPKRRQDDGYATYLKEEGYEAVQNLHGVRPHIYHIPQNAQVDEQHHGSTWVADRTIGWLEQNGENPFFLCCGWIHPHPPWNIPTELDELYEDRDLPKPIELSRHPLDSESTGEWFGDNDSEIQKRKIREAYYTAVTLVDKNVGRVIDYLRARGELDNTLIIFTSDHGEMLQDKGYYSKELPYDSAARIPFIVRYPRCFKPGEKANEFVDLLDIMPTCLDICGLEYPESKYQLPGKSLCNQQTREQTKYQLSATGFLGSTRWVMCRNNQYKYIYHYNNGIEELYDMINDPQEIHNLLQDKRDYDQIVSELRQQVIAYELEWGPEGAVVNQQLIKVPYMPFHGSLRGKFHYWSNHQMQYFDTREPNKRGEELLREMKYAVCNYHKSQVELTDVFNEKSWVQCFKEDYNKFANVDFDTKEVFR